MKKKIVVFSGAGLSAESGIPTFRSSNGLWEQHRIEDVASPEGWKRNPSLVLDFYAARFEQMKSCTPNAAHTSIARLSEQHEVVCITQNIDTLLEQAGVVGDVWHLHGRIDVEKCEKHYEIFGGSPSSLFDKRTQTFFCKFKAPIKKPVALGDRCPLCGGQLRPDVVWFGEAVDMRQAFLEDLIDTADVFIGVGTSAQVYPAAGLLPLFRKTAEKYFVDPNPARDLLSGYTVLEGTAATELPKLLTRLL